MQPVTPAGFQLARLQLARYLQAQPRPAQHLQSWPFQRADSLSGAACIGTVVGGDSTTVSGVSSIAWPTIEATTVSGLVAVHDVAANDRAKAAAAARRVGERITPDLAVALA